MKTLWRFLIAFLILTGCVALAGTVFGVRFENADFWHYHDVLFLLAIALFPRLTLLFSSIPSGGLLWWLSWLFAPRMLVAALATLVYWKQNPVLVILAWWVAFGGESTEKYVMVRRARPGRGPSKGYESARWVDPKG